MKFQKVFYGVVFIFMIGIVAFLFHIESKVYDIDSTVHKIYSTVDGYKERIDDIAKEAGSAQAFSEASFKLLLDLTPVIEHIERLSLGIPLLMR
jgi:hypothetical protein